jgi:hypothetical protein
MRSPGELQNTFSAEVAIGEWAAALKRQSQARFALVAAKGLDVGRAWVQSEMDLYPSASGEAPRFLPGLKALSDNLRIIGTTGGSIRTWKGNSGVKRDGDQRAPGA